MENIDFSEFVTQEQDEGMSGQISGSFSFKQVGSITKYVEPVSGESTIDMIVEMFQDQPDLMAVPVEYNTGGIGIIDRKTAAAATSTAWKRLTAKNISDYVSPVSIFLNARDFIEKALAKVSEINRKDGVLYFPVYYNNRTFFGIVSLDDFLERIAVIREQDMEKAFVIQQELLPDPSKIPDLPFKATCWNRMANTLGGDFYQIYPVDNSKYLVSCFDVSGKNVAASLLTIAVGSFFNTMKFMKDKPSHPSAIISLLDDYLQTTVPAGSFITAAICYVDMARKQMYLYNCGHTTVYILFAEETGEGRRVKIASVNASLPPLGMGEVKATLEKNTAGDKSYAALPIKEDMHLELYSDGFTDMQTEDGIRYDDDRSKEFFINLYSKKYEEVSDTIGKTVDGWIQNAMLPDDVTVLDIRF
ncbi:MAG: SpoIIE family protein phosphatase [Treponemataceae bacterium]|nr:SpoIIE family protein phosphatase [Treponemataceae bacterium]